jgi:hypothetical protein
MDTIQGVGVYPAVADLGPAEAAILDVHRMMLEDPDFAEAITTVIETQLVNAEYAVKAAETQFTELFTQMEDPYMRERAADVKDISERLLRALDPTRCAGRSPQSRDSGVRTLPRRHRGMFRVGFSNDSGANPCENPTRNHVGPVPGGVFAT